MDLTPGTRRMIARVMWITALVTAVASVVLAALNGWPLGFDPWGFEVAGAVVTGSLGMLVVSKRPTNVIGWLMLWMGLLNGSAAFGLQYGLFDLGGADLPLADLIGVGPFGLAVGLVFGTMITFFLLLFPDGRLPSRRWRPVAWVAATGVIVMTVGLCLHVWSLGLDEVLAQAESGGIEAAGVAGILNEVGHLLVFLVFPLAVASLFVRRRRADATQRQQLKLFAYGAVVFLTSVFVPLPEPYWAIFEMTATAFLFAAIAVAIVRYRLYDIDRLVSRTLAYVLLSATLVGIYLAGVFVLQRMLPAESQLAVAASTLAAAAAFNPLRRRVQHLVDRRFNRARYDAAQTVEGFSRELRGTAEPGHLYRRLEVTAATVMEPAHVSLWLKEAKR